MYRVDAEPGEEDAYGAPTKVGPMSKALIDKMMSDAEPAPSLPRSGMRVALKMDTAPPVAALAVATPIQASPIQPIDIEIAHLRPDEADAQLEATLLHVRQSSSSPPSYPERPIVIRTAGAPHGSHVEPAMGTAVRVPLPSPYPPAPHRTSQYPSVRIVPAPMAQQGSAASSHPVPLVRPAQHSTERPLLIALALVAMTLLGIDSVLMWLLHT